MNIKLDIYVEGQRLDLFKDEAMNVKSSLKDSLSPDKIFTAVSKSYVVPASKNNNKLFKHYYRTDISNTIDARSFLDCELRLGGVLYRQGNLTLEKVKMEHGVAKSYSVRFYGNLTELTKRIGEDSLNDLNFSDDDIPNPVWYDELKKTMNVEPAVAFPIISNKSRLIFDSGNRNGADSFGENYRNIAWVDSTQGDQYGINTDELVGAYRCENILDVIESTYGITITGALRAPYVSNYRLLLDGAQKEEKSLTPFTGYTNQTFNRTDELPTSIRDEYDGDLISTTTSSGIQGSLSFKKRSNLITSLKYKVSSSSLSEYTVHVLRDGERISSINQDSLGTYATYEFGSNDGDFLYTFEIETSGSGTVQVQYYIRHFYFTGSPAFSFVSDESIQDTISVSVTSGGGSVYSINSNLPKMKVKDFLTTLFKQFNIVTIVDGLEVQTYHYDYFMSIGDTLDITKYVDSSSATISPPNYYSGISFKNEDPITFQEEAYLAINQASYGSLEYILKEDDSKVVGSMYEIKTPTQRIPTERLQDLDTSDDAKAMTLQLTDANGDYVQTKPVFIYVTTNYTNYSTQFLSLNDGSGSVRDLSRHSIATNLYYKYQNLGSYGALCGNFWGHEIDEYHKDDRFGGLGLFNCFWFNYVSQAFDTTTRSIELKASLPMQTILSMQMNTKLVIGTQTHLIESMNTNFSTGITSFKLSSISSALLENTESSFRYIEFDDPTATNIRIVYMSSITGRLEQSSSQYVYAIGPIREIVEW